jgi:hypothetical protein
MPPPFGGEPPKRDERRDRVLNYFGARPDGLRSEVCNLAGLLTREHALMIPPYQRPYTWTEEHVDKLIQDLRHAWKRGGTYYFIGHFVLVETDKNEWQIADGQQRLATMTMIFAYVRDQLKNCEDFYQALITSGEEKRPRIRLRPKDEEFFYEYVQTRGQFSKLYALDNVTVESQARMCAAAEVIKAALQEMSNTELEAFAKFICRCALFDVIQAHEAGGAALVLATRNDRGMELSHADLMKFALLDGARMSEAEKEAAAREWEDLEDDLGRAPFGDLLKIVPIMFSGDPILAPGDLNAFVQYLFGHSSVELFLRDWLPRHGKALLDVQRESVGGPHGAEINRRLRCLKQLKDQNWLPLAVSFLASHHREHDKVRRFFRGVDLIAFGALLGAVRPESREARWKRALAAKGDEAKLYHPKTGPLCLHEFDAETSERDRFIERLGATFKRDHKRDAEKRALLLIRINACLPGGEALVREPGLTVEHILPVRGAGAWDSYFTEEQRAVYPHLIGNWTLIRREQNQMCGAKSFDEKKTIFFMQGYPVYAITRMLERVTEWNPREIESRRQTFQSALFQDWGI